LVAADVELAEAVLAHNVAKTLSLHSLCRLKTPRTASPHRCISLQMQHVPLALVRVRDQVPHQKYVVRVVGVDLWQTIKGFSPCPRHAGRVAATERLLSIRALPVVDLELNDVRAR
jgi:hypothetical protein